MTWKQRPRADVGEPARRCDRPRELPRVGVPAARRRASPGTAVFLVGEPGAVPNALLHNLKHNKVLHERNLFVTVKHHEVPWIARRQALRDRAARPRLLAGDAALRLQERARRAARRWRSSASSGCELDEHGHLYFLSRDIVIPTIGGGMADWREKLFAGMHRNARARPTSSACRRRAWSSSARRSRFEPQALASRERRSAPPICRCASAAAAAPVRRSAGRLHQFRRDRVPGRDRVRCDAGTGRARGCGRSAGAWGFAACCRRCG